MISKGKSKNLLAGAVIPAAGKGSRFGEKKQFKLFKGVPLLNHVLTPFLQSDLIYEIIVVVPEEQVQQIKIQVRSTPKPQNIRVVSGGERRQDSVSNGVKVLSNQCKLVCIHDVVRPFVTKDMINETIKRCGKYDGAIIATQAQDTIKRVQNRRIKETFNRSEIWQAQTPQSFQREKLIEVLESADRDGVTGSDEAFLLERIGYYVSVVEGTSANIKITTPEDWFVAAAIWKARYG
jgi:2-C-methyl-D-erythritol 4-phosphate cytidylyltransferase